MALSWMDADALQALLDGGLSVSLSNDADPESGVEILGAVVALHGGSGPPQIRRAEGAALSAGEIYVLDEGGPVLGDVLGAEAVLRVASPVAQIITEVYLHSDPARADPVSRMEIIIGPTDDAPGDAVPVPDIEGLSAYIKLEP